MITLIIVDCQNDFITGTMSIKGARNIIDEIKKYVKKHKQEIEKIIFTANWHPYNHMSFKKYGGKYPHHCIQYTPGACIEPKLLKFIQSLNINYEVSLRGELEELDQDGAFSEIDFVQDNFGSRYYFDSVVEANANTDFVICGIRGDDGVLNTLKNIVENSDITPKIFMKGTLSSDGGNLLSQFIKEYKIEKTV